MAIARYIYLWLALLLNATTSWAQDEPFNPDSPPEPEQPAMRLDLAVNPAEAGAASGGGRYAPGKMVSLHAYGNEGFSFVNWTNASGEEVSKQKDFTYTKQEGNELLTANFIFDPDSPADPAEPSAILYYRLVLQATEGGSVSGGGSYLAGTQVMLYASCEQQFDFAGWYDAEGRCLSTSTTFYYTTTAQHTIITGHFTFNPDNPVEPDSPPHTTIHTITATCTDGGTISWTTKRAKEGDHIEFAAYANSGYDFDGWYKNGELYTTLTQFSYTVTDETTQAFEARFIFNPDNPSDPETPTQNRHAIFLLNKVTSPGTEVSFPVYLTNIRPLRDITFLLSFPRQLLPDTEHIKLSERASGYSLSCTKQTENNEEVTYLISLVGGEVAVGSAALLTLTISVPEDIATAQNYPVKINQVSVEEITEDGVTIVSTLTRNGRISVYKLGDSNGDDDINVADLAGVALFLTDKPEENLIFYAADMNGNNVIEQVDYDLLVDSILCQQMGKDSYSRPRIKSVKKPMPETQRANRIFIPEQISIEDGSDVLKLPIMIERSADITGFQFDLFLAKGVDISTDENGDFVIDISKYGGSHRTDGLTINEGVVRFICSSMANVSIDELEGTVLTLTLRLKNGFDAEGSSIAIGNIVLTDKHAVPYYAEGVRAVIGLQSKIGIPSLNSSDTIRIYSPSGRQLRQLQQGVNIIKWSDGTTKSVVLR